MRIFIRNQIISVQFNYTSFVYFLTKKINETCNSYTIHMKKHLSCTDWVVTIWDKSSLQESFTVSYFFYFPILFVLFFFQLLALFVFISSPLLLLFLFWFLFLIDENVVFIPFIVNVALIEMISWVLLWIFGLTNLFSRGQQCEKLN